VRAKGERQKIVGALGLQTGDVIRTSYRSRTFQIHGMNAPRYVLGGDGFGYAIILDHPEISLIVGEAGSWPGGRHDSLINDVRQVGVRWYTASNDEVILIDRPRQEPTAPTSLFDLIEPPDRIEGLKAREPYSFQPGVDYKAGCLRVWQCEACGEDFNDEPTSGIMRWHDCGPRSRAIPIYYVESPASDDRRPFTSYALMTLNRKAYAPTEYTAAA
jgi:hypothetical protein